VRLEEFSTPGRVADPDEGIGLDELGLAARNHGIPLEALRYDLTPPGLHYLLIHYDIPALDERSWRLRVGGLVHTPLELDLAALRAMPARTVRVTMECAGNGRARLAPRPVSQPGLVEAVGTAEWMVRPGPVPVEGRAWSGRAPVTRVEVSVDGGDSWATAELEPPTGHRWAWRRFTHEWTASPGRYVVTARAVTTDGETQPADPVWNRGGFANNGAQRVPVVCLPADNTEELTERFTPS
jgi:hypothetical protein